MDETRSHIIQDLVTQLENDDWLVRYNAAKILGDIDAEEAIQQLLEKLGREDNRDVRRRIVQSLVKIDLNIVIPDLIWIMKSDSSMMVRYTAARALGRMGATEAIPHIIERIAKEKNNESIFWFNLALARLEEDKKGQGIRAIEEMKKKKLLTVKQELEFSKFLKELKQRKKRKK